jgi:hypothetical protein
MKIKIFTLTAILFLGAIINGHAQEGEKKIRHQFQWFCKS